jgi:hypothetical protein
MGVLGIMEVLTKTVSLLKVEVESIFASDPDATLRIGKNGIDLGTLDTVRIGGIGEILGKRFAFAVKTVQPVVCAYPDISLSVLADGIDEIVAQ